MASPIQLTHALDAQLEAHEERIQRVEKNSEESRIALAEVKTSLEYQQESIKSNHQDLAHKIDLGFNKLDTAHQNLYNKIEDQSKMLVDHHERLKDAEKQIDEDNAKSDGRKATVKKIAMGVALAMTGVLGTKIAEMLVLLWGVIR